jgi:hypothetical protein
MPRSDLATGVLLLAHRRLSTLARALDTKESVVTFAADFPGNRPNVAHQEIEARVNALAHAAVTMLEDGAAVPLPANARLGFHLSRSAVTGTFGITLPEIVALGAPDRAWIREALHRGSVDPDLSRVAVPSAEFALDVGRRALTHATTDLERGKIRALTLGMLADVATRTIVGPVLRGAAADINYLEPNLAATPAAVASGALTANRLMSGRAGAAWDDWWLPPADVPDAFFAGYAEAIAALDAVTTPLGFRAALGASRSAPPTTDQLKEAYRLFRGGTFFHPAVPPLGADRGLVWWWIMMSLPFVVGPALALPLALTTDRSKLLFPPKNPATPPAAPDGSSWLELADWGGLTGSLMPFIDAMILWSGYPAATYPFWESLVFFVWRAAFGIGGFLEGTDSSARGWLVGLQLLPDLVALVQAIVEGVRGNPGAMWIMLLQLLPAVSMGLTLIAGAAFKGAGVVVSWDSFFPAWLIVLAICLLLGFIAGAVIHFNGGLRLVPDDSHTPHQLDAGSRLGALPGPSIDEPRAPAMVFDDAVLFRIPGSGGASPTRADFAYPSGSRTLLQLSWAGRTPLTLVIDGARLTFKIATDADLVVVVPPRSTAQTLADLLVARVLDGGAQKLTVVQAAVGELQPELAFPGTAADPGDPLVSLADHDAHKGDAITISTNAAQPTTLRHAPRAHNGTRHGVIGPQRTALEAIKIVPSELLGDTDVTAMGAAAELASLLFLGAAPELAATPIAARGIPLSPVYEVFRRWNLDERSANEWRLLVSGGARSERTTAAPPVDPLRRPAPVGATVFDDAGGRALLERWGWIPTWRAWTRVATDPTQDTTAATAAPYTPPDGPAPGAPSPNNELLSRAIKTLLNL